MEEEEREDYKKKVNSVEREMSKCWRRNIKKEIYGK